jgi:protein SCO1/2
MKKNKFELWIKNSIGIVGLVFSLFHCSKENNELPYYNTPDFTPQWLDNQIDVKNKIKHQIADFKLTNQQGKTVSQADLQNKIHIANFFFTSCSSICPMMTDNLKKVQTAFQNDEDVVLLSYSVMPWVDSLSQLQSYAKNKAILPQSWHLLTGGQGDIYKLARQSYFAEEEMGFAKDSTDFLHTERVVLVDKSRRIRGVYNGTLALDMERLIADIKVLKKEE